uniref:Uncharacterized protein n=1 Tax=Anguilla anguilla TaxID=7936 RepID=A0A0E9RZM3_ANGAN
MIGRCVWFWVPDWTMCLISGKTGSCWRSASPRGTAFKVVSDIYQRESGRVQGVAQYDPAPSLRSLQEARNRNLYHYSNRTG